MATRPAKRAASPRRATPPADLAVSSSALLSSRSGELTEFEYGMNIAWNAFERWRIRCMAAAGIQDLTAHDVTILHRVNHQARHKRLADICFTLNIEDTHVVSYSLRKLVNAGLVESEKRGKEAYFITTARGREVCERYRQLRETFLVSALTSDPDALFELGELGRFLRVLSGLYDQAARGVSTL
jgi:predicted MarR family transcription regulator